MKDYLKEKLTQEERLIILGLIWKVARKYKRKYFLEQKRYCEIIDNIDLQVEDTYTFYTYNSQRDIVSLTPLTDEQKCDIVMEFDSLLRESCLFELIRTLTFNEKLVLFLFYLEEYKNMEVAALLNNAERTILNRRKSIDNKIKKMKGEL
jgi:DNA-directed RNA polymerase specialized sigma subunit